MCEFLFRDVYSEKVGYLKFQERIELILGERFLNVKEFTEELRKSKKSKKLKNTISFNKIRKAFICYKYNTNRFSVETKNFIAYIFKEVLKVIIYLYCRVPILKSEDFFQELSRNLPRNSKAENS